MRRLITWLTLIGMLTARGSGAVDAGELAGMRQDLHAQSGGTKSSAPANPPRHSHDDCDSSAPFSSLEDDDETSLTDTLFAAGAVVTGAVVTSPFWGPHGALNDDLDRDGWFPKHPYRETTGAMAFDHYVSGTHDTLVVLQGVFGTDFDDLSLLNGRLFAEHRSRFGIDTEFNYREEDLVGGAKDHLWHGDVNLTYRFAQSESWLFRAGLGMNWLGNRGKFESGFNFTYGAEWFPLEPVVVSGVIDWGRISSASMFHGRATVGLTKNGWGVFTGYDYFRLSDSDVSSWISGLEYRF